MKLNIHITLTILSGIILAGLMTGCVIPMKEDIARSTTEFNIVAEKVGNEMLLLNIIRASKRRPMYFTSIGTLRGNKTFEYGTGGISIPFGQIGKGANTSYSIAPSAGYRNSPVFDVSVLNTQEFTRGIISPVPMETIEYYWRQGWHKEMLLHLFIRRIDPNDPKDLDKNGKPNVYLNYPGDWCEFKRFQKQIQDWEWDIEEKVNTTIVEVDVKETSKLKNLIEVQKAGLKLEPFEDDKMKLYLRKVEYFFTRTRTDEKGEEEKETFDKSKGTIYLRSPEAIIYYLGEILRAEIRGENKGTPNPYIPIIHAGLEGCAGTENRLFYAHEVSDKKVKDKKVKDKEQKPCLSVDYEGIRYVIPGAPDTGEGCCTDRSMHVLSLVSLLIGQQKKSELVPTTGVVSVIGR